MTQPALRTLADLVGLVCVRVERVVRTCPEHVGHGVESYVLVVGVETTLRRGFRHEALRLTDGPNQA